MPAPRPDLTRRRAGVCLHLTSLPGSPAIGELGRPSVRFLDWMQAAGLGVWQFLPTGPTGYGNSPYQPLSVFAGNPLLIGLEELAELGLLGAGELANARVARAGARVDYAQARAVKEPLLALAADRFLALGDFAGDDGFEAFCAANDAVWLDDFATYVVLKRRCGGAAWTEWRDADRQHRPTQRAGFGPAETATWRRTKVIQYFFARQWEMLREAARRRDIVLFGDVPIYMALDCAEAWAHPELLLLDEDGAPLELAGVPPDYFSAEGQLWGNPVYRWEVHAQDGYAWWIARLKRALATADLVRLDHFRGFESYWSVPRGAPSARDGRWNPGPGHALFDALAEALGSVPVVAEDLGVITEAVTALRKAYALPGMQVLQFLVDQAGFDSGIIEEDCVCYTGTHDNDTTRGWYAGSEGRLSGDALAGFQQTIRSNLEDTEENIHKAMIRLCFSTRASIGIAPMQDFLGLGSEARLNTPGIAAGNWLWRLGDAALETSATDWIADAVATAGRA